VSDAAGRDAAGTASHGTDPASDAADASFETTDAALGTPTSRASPTAPDPAEFEALRPLLFTVAYEMLEVAADAEDVVQEAWLRWSRVDTSTVRDERAYLVRIVTRLALNRLRTVARRREAYVGPWLPEPLVTVPDVAEDVELADSVSTAMLVVLGTLTPLERAVFVLREVFDVPYDEIAEGVDRTPAAVRQIAHRAREHVSARRPRRAVDPSEHRVVLERFRLAAVTGDVAGLVDVLAPDVLLVTDGGGVRKAALHPIRGRDKVLRFIAAVTPPDVVVTWRVTEVGGLPALVATLDGVVDSVITIDPVDGLVGSLYLVRNPDKLTGLGREVRLAR
jgi:RNA polymerase sigma-70 factor (TIGR02957 family)